MLLSSVLALAVFVLAGCGGEVDGDGDDGGRESAATARIGQPLSLEGTTYTVTRAMKKKAVGGQFTKTRADGVFVIVNLTLKNEKDKPATIFEDAVRLVGGNGKEYTVDTDAALTFKNSLLLLQEIQPDLAKKVVAVYDVPPRAARGATLQVRDLFSDARGEIDLGLK